jgi:hypothetical protein
VRAVGIGERYCNGWLGLVPLPSSVGGSCGGVLGGVSGTWIVAGGVVSGLGPTLAGGLVLGLAPLLCWSSDMAALLE